MKFHLTFPSAVMLACRIVVTLSLLVSASVFRSTAEAQEREDSERAEPRPGIVRDEDFPGPLPEAGEPRRPFPHRDLPERSPEGPRRPPRRFEGPAERRHDAPPHEGRRPLPPDAPRHRPPSRMDWETLKRHDPELYELERADYEFEAASFELAQQYARASEEARTAIRRQLNEIIAKHFDARQARRRLQLQRLEEELAKARKAVEERDAAREELLSKRLSELIGEGDTPGF